MPKKIKRALVLTAAVLFIILGVIGLALPFLQGFLFLAIGLLLLSLCFPGIRVWMDSHTTKYPKLHAVVQKVDGWVSRVVGEV